MATGLASNINNSDMLKQQLIDCVTHGKTEFMKVAKAFYQNSDRTREDNIAFTQAIIEAVDEVLKAGDWDDSLFLRNTLKPLKAIREEAANLLKEATATLEEQQVTLRALNENEMLVYISIFQSGGDNLRRWELQLSSLRSHLLGRPIYEREEDVKKVIRQKLVKSSEAYVVIAIERSGLQEFAHQAKRVDRYGNVLLTLKDSAVKPDNIFEFVHQDKRYFFRNGKLIPQI